MRIGQYAPVFQISPKGTEKSGDRDSSGSGGFQRQEKGDKDSRAFEATLEAVDEAVEKFSGEESTLASGITAESSGNGPGLKVVLKDASGGVLRSVSGEEFLKLREAASLGRKSGRILDQKA